MPSFPDLPVYVHSNTRIEEAFDAKRMDSQNQSELLVEEEILFVEPDLVNIGRHFCRTIHPFPDMHGLISNEFVRMHHPEATRENSKLWTIIKFRRSVKEVQAITALYLFAPGLETSIYNATARGDLVRISYGLLRGVNQAIEEDAVKLCDSILDWLDPLEPLSAAQKFPLKGTKTGRGFWSDITGRLLCPANVAHDYNRYSVRILLRNHGYNGETDEWPIFLYKDYKYNHRSPLSGLFFSKIMFRAYLLVFPDAFQGSRIITLDSLVYTALHIHLALSEDSALEFWSEPRSCYARLYGRMIRKLEHDWQHEDRLQKTLSYWNRITLKDMKDILQD